DVDARILFFEGRDDEGLVVFGKDAGKPDDVDGAGDFGVLCPCRSGEGGNGQKADGQMTNHEVLLCDKIQLCGVQAASKTRSQLPPSNLAMVVSLQPRAIMRAVRLGISVIRRMPAGLLILTEPNSVSLRAVPLSRLAQSSQSLGRGRSREKSV